MTQEEKRLLLIDICGRLPYDSFVQVYYFGKEQKEELTSYNFHLFMHGEVDILPYLRPMSSMNGKEWMEYCDASLEDEKSWMLTKKEYKFTPVTHREEFLNSHHFDYRGLIPMGLAIEAPEGMYPIR